MLKGKNKKVIGIMVKIMVVEKMKNLMIPIFIAIIFFTLFSGAGQLRKTSQVNMIQKVGLVKTLNLCTQANTDAGIKVREFKKN